MSRLSASSPRPAVGFRELIALVAAIMALNALALDQMLPALPAIGGALHILNPNDRQWIITAYFIGLGAGSLVYGSLSDWFGRKPVLVITMALFLLATLVCALAQDFATMLAARGGGGGLRRCRPRPDGQHRARPVRWRPYG